MCGICGIYRREGVKENELIRMSDALSHRGPDDEGIFIDDGGRVGFGHRRLSIIDLTNGKQPMSNEDNTIWISFNGEIYNYKEIKKTLRHKHTFRTDSDTEVIIHLYEETGEDCVKLLRGMFAFAIYDTKEEKIYAARDHLGQKPLYYYSDDREFAFASEIKGLLALNPYLNRINEEALYEYLTLRIITPPRSMFHKIKKLAPAHHLTFQRGKLKVQRYWDLKYEPKWNLEYSDILHELEYRLQSSIKYNLVSDVPVGAFLSGGLDSSLIVAMMSRVDGENIQTFSGDVHYGNFSEIPFAKMVAHKYKTDNHVLTVQPSLVRSLPNLVWHLDEPSDPLSVCMYYIAELARKEVKVVLGGDGGDELFGGYDRYYGNILVDYYALLPEVFRYYIMGKMLKFMPENFWYRSYSHQLRWIHQISFSKGAERYARGLSYFYFSDDFKKKLYTDRFQRSIGMFDPEGSVKKFFNTDNATDFIDRMLHSDSMVRMPDHPNMILDRMTMAHGLEARSPFLDHEMAEFCAKIPTKLKVRGIKKRYIETELAKKYLPSPLLRKKKQGFSSALPYLLADEFRFLFKTFLSDSSLVKAGFLNHSTLNMLLREHLDKKRDHGNRLWLLCNAEVWYRMYIEGQGRDRIREIIQTHKTTGKPGIP